jgi:para-aminobenzoate synthetase component 1
VAEAFQPAQDLFSSLSAFDARTRDWIFGHVGFDAVRDPGDHPGGQQSGSCFPGVYLFIPEVVVELKADTLRIGVLHHDAGTVYGHIMGCEPLPAKQYHAQVTGRITREQFINTIETLQQHIRRGDCYEINYCQEFFAESVLADPADLYRQLTAVSPNPFSCFYRVHDQYALCASPERYLKKQGDFILSQPIKGTAPRAPQDPALDEQNRIMLQHSEKDRRENVIVVDLVRNDLSRICEPGTVQVEDLFGVYAFPTVYQMISTVTGKLMAGQDFSRVLEATFPMGSMTGAPKKRVLELIDRYEPVRRGLYSGTIGYITPEKEYDFNVVIRTILYNGGTGYMNYFAGAGITHLSDAAAEYEECLLKAAALVRLFGSNLHVPEP